MPAGPPLPEHPELRARCRSAGGGSDLGRDLDAQWRLVFISSEEARIIGVEPSEVGRFYGKGLPVRQLEDAEYWATTDNSSRDWWKLNVPIMRVYLDPDDDAFAGGVRSARQGRCPGRAGRADSGVVLHPFVPGPRRSAHLVVGGRRRSSTCDINDDAGEFIGVLRLATPDAPDSLLARMARGDRAMHERMDAVMIPGAPTGEHPVRRPRSVRRAVEAAVVRAAISSSSGISPISSTRRSSSRVASSASTQATARRRSSWWNSSGTRSRRRHRLPYGRHAGDPRRSAGVRSRPMSTFA